MLTLVKRLFFLAAVAAISRATLLPDTPARSEEQAYRKWALLIGCDEYINLKPLKCPGKDVRALGAQLEASGFPRDQIYVLDAAAKENKYRPFRANIDRELDQVLKLPQEGDLIVVMFSGHGVQVEGKDRWCALDTQLRQLKESTIEVAEVYNRLGRCKAAMKLLIVDACRNDPGLALVPESKKGQFDSSGLGNYGSELPPKGIMLLNSCGDGQEAQEDPERLGYSVFTHFLLEGMRGKAADEEGAVSLLRLADYAGRATMKWVHDKFNDYQSPALEGRSDGPFVICTKPTLLKVTTSSIGMKLVLIPAGEFMMGSPESETGRSKDEGPQHRVRITRAFYMGQYPVTQAEYEQVMGSNPSYFSAGGNGKDKVAGLDTSQCPVENALYDDARDFCRRLSEKEGKQYHLPTEAQWEYACRAGSTTRYSFGDSGDSELGDYAWYEMNSDDRTHSVGQKKPNAWGLYDMHGNVWQWCSDWYGGEYYATSPVDDPAGPDSGSLRVFRGGGWSFYAGYCRSAYRGWYSPDSRYYFLGFRVALVPAE